MRDPSVFSLVRISFNRVSSPLTRKAKVMQDSELLLQEKSLTIQQIAEYLQTTEETILGFVRRGDLAAININLKPDAQRPRWRIEPGEFRRFLLRSRHQSVPATPARKRAKHTAKKDYFA